MRSLLVCFVSLAFGCAAEDPAPEIRMHDVSVVWPMPVTMDAVDDGWLRGRDGPMPRAVFDHVPRLTRTDEIDDLYGDLLVVGARLDPCFREGGSDAPCRPNVRLVLQPVRPPPSGANETPTARDASMHAFYDAASEGEILDAVKALAELRAARGVAADGPLGVHPLLVDGEGRRDVADVLRPLLLPDRLSRVTSMGVHGEDTAWTFSGFDLVDGEPRAIVIAATDGVTEQHALSDGAPGAIHASVEPPLAAEDDITLLLDDARARAATKAERQAAFDAAARIENPTRHDPGTIDCVSCHLAPTARAAALQREPMDASPDVFTSTRHDLTPTSYDDTRMVRAFGWRYRELALSQRVVNESAAVADLVQSLLSGGSR